MDLFVCSSNYQLLNAIMIVKENKIDADILIVRESICSGCNLDVLVEHGIFNRLYKWTDLLEVVTDEKIKKTIDKFKVQIKRIFKFMHKDSIWNSLPNKDKRYEKVHIAYVDSIALWIYSHFKKTGSKLSLYEDGTYSYGCLEVKKSYLRRIGERVLYNGRGIDECVQMYVKHPERVKRGSHKNVFLIKFNEQYDKETVMGVLLPLYRCDTESISEFKRSVIVFDQNVELNEVKKIQKEIVKKTVDICGNENVLLKLHPSSRDVNYGCYVCQFKEKLPLEVVMTYTNMNEKILISIFSTACMSPKLDYGQEPYIIFTYKLYGEYMLYDDVYLEQINLLRDKYIKKERVAVPCDLDEFVEVLNTFLEKIK